MIYLPKINPISFTQLSNKQNTSPDLGGVFYGVDYVELCRMYPIGKNLIFIFESDSATPIVKIGSTTLTPTDITPASWSGQGTYVYQVTHSHSTEEETYFYLIEDGNFWESENIKFVQENELSDWSMIEYSNSENDYGYIGSSTMTVYYLGQFMQPVAANEMDVYQNDRGEMTKLRATPIESYLFSIDILLKNSVTQLGLIFSCDTIAINGESFQNEAPPEGTRIEQSDLFTLEVTISRIDDEYSFLNNATDGLSMIGNVGLDIISNNENEMIIL